MIWVILLPLESQLTNAYHTFSLAEYVLKYFSSIETTDSNAHCESSKLFIHRNRSFQGNGYIKQVILVFCYQCGKIFTKFTINVHKLCKRAMCWKQKRMIYYACSSETSDAIKRHEIRLNWARLTIYRFKFHIQ